MSQGSPVAAPVRSVVIRPSRGWRSLDLREWWAYRELLYFFAWRDVKVRYKQTVLGGLWAVVQPLLTMVVFTIVFGRLADIPSDGTPYAVFAFAGLVPWIYFSNALGQAANSVIVDERLITKIYFPRVLVPAAAVLPGLLDLAIAFVVLLGLMLYYGVTPGPALLLVPLLVLLAALAALGFGLWLAGLNVQYRDVRYVIPFFIQVWLFATPVAYPSSLVPEGWRFAYGLNPMAGVVEGFRWALLGDRARPDTLLAAGVLSVALVLAGGLFYFRRVEAAFADVI